MTRPATFTAAELARALGVSPQAVRKRLRSTPSGIVNVHGLETRAWNFSDLPAEMRQRLLSAKQSGGHRSFSFLAETRQARLFHSGLDINAPGSQATVSLAAELRECLADLIGAGESFAAMAAAALPRMAQRPSLPLFSARTMRRAISRIVTRDGGACAWDNLHLYIAEVLLWSKIQDSRDPVGTAGQPAAQMPFHGSAAEWEQACRDWQEIARNSGHKAATRRTVDRILAAGFDSSREAARQKLRRAIDRYAAGARGIDLIRDFRTDGPGREPIVELTEDEVREVKALAVQTGSVTAAYRMYAARPDCREEVADAILKRRQSKHTLTPTLRKQAAVPQAVREHHKSPTRATRENFINPRTLSFIDARGQEQRILPGMFAERDDMSNNFIFWIDWPWGGDPCSDKYGVRIARGQNLLHIDVGSLRFLSFLMLVRLRDSYRADDIWQWVGQGYRDLGIPEIGERWERGIWNAQKLHGLPVEAGHTSQEERLGGITALGRRIITSQSPTTKIIENRFRYLQRVCADIPGQIGATRGEIEPVNKLWTQCRQGRRDPRQYFLSYEQICQSLESKLQ